MPAGISDKLAIILIGKAGVVLQSTTRGRANKRQQLQPMPFR
jgi:hypothetical protein